MQHRFTTPDPVELWIEVGRGRVAVRTADVDETTVDVTGDHAEQTVVEQRDGRISVVTPRADTGFLRRDPSLVVEVVAPVGSLLATRTGSADLAVTGTVGELHAKSGSGSITADSVAGTTTLDTGSGDVVVASVDGDVRAKSGSGDLTLGPVLGSVALSTGSGDIRLDRAGDGGVVKTGSGGVHVRELAADLTISSGSGDLAVESMSRGSLQAKSASGDVTVGVVPGIAVWTDITTASGVIRSDLAGAGEPAPGDPHLEIRAKTSSGDVNLKQR